MEVEYINKPQNNWRSLSGYWLLGFFNSIHFYILLFAAHYSEIHAHLWINVPTAILKVLPLFLSGFLRTQVIALSSIYLLSSVTFIILSKWQFLYGHFILFFLYLLASGFGEVFFLSYSSRYHKKVISAWSSGKGASGVVGVIIWTVIKNQKWPFLSMNIVPLISIPVVIVNLVAFFYLLRSPIKKVDQSEALTEGQTELIGFRNKFTYIPKLFKYMIPLGLAVIFQFFGMSFFYCVDLPTTYFVHDQYQVFNLFHGIQFIGFFLAGTFHSFLKFKSIWWFAILQLINMIILLIVYMTKWVPVNWIMYILILWIGLLEGGVYVKTFYRIHKEEHPVRKQFSLGMTTIVISIGIIVSGVASIFMKINYWW